MLRKLFNFKTLAVVLASSLTLFAGDTKTPDKTTDTSKATTVAKTPEVKKKPAKRDPDQIGNRDVGKGLNFYSLEKEIALGKGLATDIERQAKIVDDPLVAEYVSRVGQNLVRNSDAKVPFTIKVVESEDVNAFALPGGFFYVNTGVIMAAESESELAGVMGHEIAHIAGRHGTKQATKGTIANLATIPLMFTGFGWTSLLIRQGASILIPLVFLQFNQAQEREADVLGLQYMYKAGYDPTSFVDFFEKLQSREKRKPGTMAKIFSSHPLTAQRVTDAQKNIGEMLAARPDYVVTTSEFNEVKTRLMAMNGRRKATPEDPNRPRLKRAPGGTVPADDGKGGTKAPTDEDDRPTLKKRQ